MGSLTFKDVDALRADHQRTGTFGEAITGIDWYPQMMRIALGAKWGDHFARTTITPTSAPTIWEAGGAGSAAIELTAGSPYYNHGVELITGGGANADASLRCSGLMVSRNIESISEIKITITARLASATNTRMFLGLIDQSLGDPPTTQRHIGFLIPAASDNWRGSVANGTTQSTTGTTVAADTSSHDFIFDWTSGNVNFDIDTTDIGNLTTNIPADNEGLMLMLFAETDDTLTQTARIDKVLVEFLA